MLNNENDWQLRAETAERELCVAASLLEWVDTALRGREVSDFAESFPIVRMATDLVAAKDQWHKAHGEAADLIDARDERIQALELLVEELKFRRALEKFPHE